MVAFFALGPYLARDLASGDSRDRERVCRRAVAPYTPVSTGYAALLSTGYAALCTGP